MPFTATAGLRVRSSGKLIIFNLSILYDILRQMNIICSADQVTQKMIRKKYVRYILSSFLVIYTLHLLGNKPPAENMPPAENRPYRLTTVSQLQDEGYSEEIESFYDKGEEGTFTGAAGVAIYYKIFRQQEAGPAIMISTGRTEAAIKYTELIFDLYNNGYSVYIHDHRGQGLSERMADDPEMGHIDTFQFYVDDMKSFYMDYVRPAGHNGIYLMAHSMGGAIGMTYLEQHPLDFKAAVFSSPMLGLSPPICAAASLLNSRELKYAPGKSGYAPGKEKIFEGNTLTGSEVRFKRAFAAFARVPEARLGGPSIQWVHRSCRQFRFLFDQIDRIETPFILFSAEHEQIVDPRSHYKFMESAQELGKECELHPVEDAQHELFIEKDPQRTEVLNASLHFFEEK
jgi:lysophospholipase